MPEHMVKRGINGMAESVPIVKINNKVDIEYHFTPLFNRDKNLQPKPNHVDNNVFGAVPLELYMKTKEKKYLDLGLKYADSQWILPKDATPEQT